MLQSAQMEDKANVNLDQIINTPLCIVLVTNPKKLLHGILKQGGLTL